MRTFSILIGSAMLVAAFGTAIMAEELKDCAGHYNPTTGTSFGRCPGMTFERGMEGPSGSAAAAAASSSSSGSSGSGGSATGAK
jgi:hypothetical protein